MAIGGEAKSGGALRPTAQGEPTVRGNMLKSFRSAAVELWKEEVLTEIGAQLTDEVRASTVGTLFILSDAVFPERYVLEWLQAVWQGPCRRDHGQLRTFMARACELGFARVRRLLLNMSSPAQLVDKVPAIWDSQHSHGKLTMALVGANQLRVRLADHPYVKVSLARVAMGEFYRGAVALCRGVNEADEYNSHLDSDGAFCVDIRWR